MRIAIPHLLACACLLFTAGLSHAGKFIPVAVNKNNQKERSGDYFAIEVGKGEDDTIHFTVRVTANPLDKQAKSGFCRLEFFEKERRIAWIPLERGDAPEGKPGHIITFEMSRAMAAQCTLVLVEFTMEVGGNVYQVDLGSYLPKQ